MWNVSYPRNEVPAVPENPSDTWPLYLYLQQPAAEKKKYQTKLLYDNIRKQKQKQERKTRVFVM